MWAVARPSFSNVNFLLSFVHSVTWKDLLFRCNVVLRTDSDAVRDCFITCHTTSENALLILDACLKIENQNECNSWITRVPTESNIADDPSRLDIQQLIECGCVRDRVDCVTIWQSIVQTGQNLKWGRQLTSVPTPLDKNSVLQCEGHQCTT